MGCESRRSDHTAAIVASTALVLGLAFRWQAFARIPIDPERADMLPLVQGAIGRLAHGQSPYGWYAFPWRVPLTYLPLGWLPFGPCALLGLDLRWTNVAAELALWPLLGPIQGAIWFLLPTTLMADVLTVAPVQWLALVGLIVATLRRSRWTPEILGLALSTSVLTLPLMPFLAVRWTQQAGIRRTMDALIRAGALFFVLVAPWAWWSPTAFLEGTVRWFNDLDQFPRQAWQSTHAWAIMPSFARFFWLAGLEAWLKPLQIAMLAACLLWASRAQSDRTWTRIVALALLLFVALNPVVWLYLYAPGVLIGLASYSRGPVSSPLVGSARLLVRSA